MNKYIEIISQLKPKNNQTFPIADVNDLIGGYMQVANPGELNSINTAKRRKGMLCYVGSEDKIYKYNGSAWEELTVGGNSSVYHLEYPGVENSDNLELTEEQYNDIVNSDLIVINNKYIIIAKEILKNQQNYLCTLTAILNSRQRIFIEISIDYTAQSSIVDIFQGVISQHTGDSYEKIMSQRAVTSELNKKQDKFDIGDGLELTDGILQCTLDTSIYVIVEELPATGLPNKIYLINNHSSEDRNTYSEYIFADDEWERLGTYQATIDLEDYITKSDLDDILEDLYWSIDLYDSDLIIKNKNTDDPLSINDDIYNTKDFYIVFDDNVWELITKAMYAKCVINQGDASLQTMAISTNDSGVSIIGVETFTGKLMQLCLEAAEDIESGQNIFYIYFTDYDYLTSKDLVSVNRQLDALDFKINNIPIVPIQKTYYEVTDVEMLEGIPEGSLLFVPQYIEDFVKYQAYKWIDDLDGFTCYTETANDVSEIYSDIRLTNQIYESPEYKKQLESESSFSVIYIYQSSDNRQVHRCVSNGWQEEQIAVPYTPGFYIKTSTELKKIASIDDIPTKNSQLENDSKFIHTINEKKTNNGKLTINADDIVVSGEYIIPDIQGGGDSEKIEYSASVNDAIMESLNKGEENFAHISYLYETKVDKEDIPEPETYILNFTIADGINSGSYDSTEYSKLLAAIKHGKLVIVKGGATRVTADSQAVADKDAYVVIRYSTPRISDDSKSITISFYELKFGDIDSSGQCKFQSKAIHKQLS